MAVLSAVAALVCIARFNSAAPTAGTNYEMDAISACVVGGVSAYGGSGTVSGMVVGATLIGVINLGMSLMGIDANWQKVVKGVVLLAGGATGGGSSRVVIRGNASMTGNNMPLYVIDGVPFDNSSQGSGGTWGGTDMGDGLSNISADDIESIQVLKGAAASALYGYRGGNGAVLITTKSGKKGQPVSIEVNNNLTFNTIYDQRDFQKVFGQGKDGKRPMDIVAAQESETSNWGEALDGGEAVNFLGNKYKYSYVDNFDNFYRTGVTENASVAISGSDQKVTYRLGATYNKEKGILPNANNRQVGFNMNTTYNLFKNLTATVTANYIFEKFNGRSSLSDGNGNTNASLLWHANSFSRDQSSVTAIHTRTRTYSPPALLPTRTASCLSI